MRAPERLGVLRVVASPDALNAAVWPDGVVLRIGPDEALSLRLDAPKISGDPHAIVRRDDGYAALWLTSAEAHEVLSSSCEWELPTERPAFAQEPSPDCPSNFGSRHDRVLILVPAPYAAEFAERLS